MIDVERDFERMRDYVRGRLPDDERRTFEDRLTRDPVLVREFEQTLRLREGLEQLKEQGYFAGLAPLNTRRLAMWMPALAAAAIAALAVILWVQPPAGLIEFRASPDGHVANARYSMTLERVGPDGATETLGTLTDLATTADGYLHGYGAVANLTAGRYLLRVEPVGPAAGNALSFPFELHDR